MVNLVSKNTWAPVFDHYEVNKDLFHLRAVLGEAERYVSWNFLNITDICGTIEFRRLPAVKTSEDAKHWAAFALGFVAGAITVENWKEIGRTTHHPSTDYLRGIITRGARSINPSIEACLHQSLLGDNNEPPTVRSAAELRKIEQMMEEKNKKPSVFVENARFMLIYPWLRQSS